MKNLVLFGIFVLFLVAVQFASGQTVDEIIEKHIRQRGGFDKLAAIKSIYMEGIISMWGNVELIKIYKEKNSLNPMGFNTFWQIGDLESNSTVADHFFLNNKMADDFVAVMQTDTEASIKIENNANHEFSAVLIGKEDVDGTNCNQIKFVTKSGDEILYWISLSGNLLIQSLSKSRLANNNQNESQSEFRTLYTSYKPVDGVIFAHSISMTLLEENAVIEINFNKVEINKRIEINFLNQYKQS